MHVGLVFNRAACGVEAANIIAIGLDTLQTIVEIADGYCDRDGGLDIKLVKVCVGYLDGPASAQAKIDCVQNRGLAAVAGANETVDPRGREPRQVLDATKIADFYVSYTSHAWSPRVYMQPTVSCIRTVLQRSRRLPTEIETSKYFRVRRGPAPNVLSLDCNHRIDGPALPAAVQRSVVYPMHVSITAVAFSNNYDILCSIFKHGALLWI